jgi:hypothetical protein
VVDMVMETWVAEVPKNLVSDSNPFLGAEGQSAEKHHN